MMILENIIRYYCNLEKGQKYNMFSEFLKGREGEIVWLNIIKN